MRLDEIRAKDDADLEVILEKTRRQLFDFRLKTVTGENESPHHAGELRSTVARILTVLTERQQSIRGEKPHLSE
ncbi:MAG: 50S ribosomal protein L29 [Salinibacterium sp.]|nr:50S ribosomal protein L29 [Planctomycetota bacterium]MCB1281150.1 50S ribosomal protein L29 [Salinibacterium sp.]